MTANTTQKLNDCNELLQNIVNTILQTRDKNIIESLLVGKGVGIGASTGLFGLASLGTASTGTAIGTLSGGALTNASLAWIGGSIFTGTIVLAGVGLGTGYLAQKFYNGEVKDINNLSKEEQKVIDVSLALIKIIQEELSLNREVNIAPLYKALSKLDRTIYIHSDNISNNLNMRYKITWRTNRLKLSKLLKNF